MMVLQTPRCELRVPQVARALQVGLAVQKWRLPLADDGPYSDRALSQVAVDGFLQRNRIARDQERMPSWLREGVRRRLASWLPCIDYVPKPRLGPGAVAEKLSWLRKRSVLNRVAPAYWDYPLYRPADLTDHQVARLAAVPKSWRSRRLITVEPIANTILQQAARDYTYMSLMSGPLRRARYWRQFWELAQSIQRQRAVEGSAHGRTCTLDLSAASDGLSYGIVSDVFPAHIMSWLDYSRTPFISVDGEVIDLYIYAGMGNATTFLIETLFFQAVVSTLCAHVGIKPACTTFGDDIICNCDLMRYIPPEGFHPWFCINPDKSYWTGNFRESCGVFAYQGEDITPIMVRGIRVQCAEGKAALSVLWQAFRDRWVSLRSTHLYGEGDRKVLNAPGWSQVLQNYRWLPHEAIGMSDEGLPYAPQRIRWNGILHRWEVQAEARKCDRKYYTPGDWGPSAAAIEAIRPDDDAVVGPASFRHSLPVGERVGLRWMPI